MGHGGGSLSDPGCPFCGIAGGRIPARIVRRTRLSVSFLDASPLARGHVLAVPSSHRERIQDMTEEECSDLFGLVRSLASGTDSIHGSTLVAVHNGPGAGQEVPHVHVHLVPRRDGDGAGPVHSMFGAADPGADDPDEVCRLVGKESLP
ncbi:MAG: HIT family protein [Nitrosopumilus sp.]|nr:HIT family protein [Nitrosopumilus sp.]CAI9831510.1 Diadenosine tetraphosphate hydrolase [Nitrosopumilaceae archaeon]MDA7940794.1 HIT family protein [Nitrosopumilus sp.]MDA7943002.1 HIT family protein [Nitrosopumilus sp.]MDA7944587.1 HIT family protein [Nitrosopumilus sp.]